MKTESFRARVMKVVSEIPEGETCSYSEVARRAGSPRAARAVGRIMSANYDPRIPCHRVIRANGDVGEYNRGRSEKQKRLQDEAVL